MSSYQLIKARGIFDHARGTIDPGKCILVKDGKIHSIDTTENLEHVAEQVSPKLIDLSDRYADGGLCPRLVCASAA